jgi:ribosomal protein L11 methyltransferase
MTWWALDVRGGLGLQESLAAWLVTHTGQAVEERPDGTVLCFTAGDAEADRLISALHERFGRSLQVARSAVEEVDWSSRWREGLGPRRVGRLTLVPSWVSRPPDPSEVVIVIDPESAFGSGEHGSTRAALHLLERSLRGGDFVLDIGCGSGILTIAAARLGAARAVGIERDVDAIPIATRNAERNGVDGVVAFFLGDGGELAPLFAPVDLVLSNILRTVNVDLLPSIHRTVRRGGSAIFSGMEVAEAADFRAPLLAAGFEIREEVADEGWWAVAAERA